MRTFSSFTFIFILALIQSPLLSQSLSGPEILQRTLAYHDPAGSWSGFEGQLQLKGSFSFGKDIETRIRIDLPRAYYEAIRSVSGHKILTRVDRNACSAEVDGSNRLTAETVEAFRLDCESIMDLRNFHLSYLGLPMILQSPDYQVDPLASQIQLKGRSFLLLSIFAQKGEMETLDHYLINPETYALEGYIPDTDEGEPVYALFEGEILIQGIRMPQKRRWYTLEGKSILWEDQLFALQPLGVSRN